MAPKRQSVMNMAIRDKNSLYAAYMPFIKNGGIFISTNKLLELGDEVFLLLTLLDDSERHPVTGKVVWINPTSMGGRPTGIGIQFNSGDNGNTLVQKKIETYLAGFKSGDRPTYTL